MMAPPPLSTGLVPFNLFNMINTLNTINSDKL